MFLFLSDEGPTLETLDYIYYPYWQYTPTFLYFDLYLYSAYAGHYVYIYIQWRRQGGARGGGRPPNVFQSVVLDSFKSDKCTCVHLFIESTDLCSNIKFYVAMFFEVIKSQTTVSYVIY